MGKRNRKAAGANAPAPNSVEPSADPALAPTAEEQDDGEEGAEETNDTPEVRDPSPQPASAGERTDSHDVTSAVPVPTDAGAASTPEEGGAPSPADSPPPPAEEAPSAPVNTDEALPPPSVEDPPSLVVELSHAPAVDELPAVPNTPPDVSPATLVRCRARTTVAVRGAFNDRGEPVRRVREGDPCQVTLAFFQAHQDLFERL